MNTWVRYWDDHLLFLSKIAISSATTIKDISARKRSPRKRKTRTATNVAGKNAIKTFNTKTKTIITIATNNIPRHIRTLKPSKGTMNEDTTQCN